MCVCCACVRLCMCVRVYVYFCVCVWPSRLASIGNGFFCHTRLTEHPPVALGLALAHRHLHTHTHTRPHYLSTPLGRDEHDKRLRPSVRPLDWSYIAGGVTSSISNVCLPQRVGGVWMRRWGAARGGKYCRRRRKRRRHCCFTNKLFVSIHWGKL